MRLLASFIAFAFLLTPQRPAQSAIAIAKFTTLCEVSARANEYNGKLVTFTAEFRTDHIERSLLIDGSCPNESLLPYLTDTAFGKKAFDDASYLRIPPSLEARITAKFTGVFHFTNKPEMCMIMNKEVCRRSLEITRVDELRVVMQPSR